MCLKDNIFRIEKKITPFYSILMDCMNQVSINNYSLIETKTHEPSLEVSDGEKRVLLHSKYNPRREAEVFAKECLPMIEGKDHILFVGIGLGYHVEEIMKHYPNHSFSIIEPNPYIFSRFLESRSLEKFPFQQLDNIYIQNETTSMMNFLFTNIVKVGVNTQVIVLPIYERIYSDQINLFMVEYNKSLRSVYTDVNVTEKFGKNWVINSLMNIPTTLTCPNIAEKKPYFEGKPIIIAAAGPSIYDDLEYLREIKEKGYAYIFAAGSAIKVLLEYDIIPDAVITYDPLSYNVNVYQELIVSGREDIPLIFGSTVGFETLKNFNGPMFHFITSIDTVSQYYLNREQYDYDVLDATTVSLIGIQVAELLGAREIILSGLNLSFRNNRYYSKGIKYFDWNGEVREDKEGLNVIQTKGVHGELINTNNSLLTMKHNIESYIETRPSINIINTTKDGAEIKGTKYTPIEKLIENFNAHVTNPQWFLDFSNNRFGKVDLNKLLIIQRSLDEMEFILDKCTTRVSKLLSLLSSNEMNKEIPKLILAHQKEFGEILNNTSFKVYLHSIVKYDIERRNKIIKNVNYTNELAKVKKVLEMDTKIIDSIIRILSEIRINVIEAHENLKRKIDSRIKLINHSDGCFCYTGNWKRADIKFVNMNNKGGNSYNRIGISSSNKGAKIRFRFKGTKIQLLAATQLDYSSQVMITIDGMSRKFSTKCSEAKLDKYPNVLQVVFEATNLSDSIHEVIIELMESKTFLFQGVLISQEDGIFHIDEVFEVKELEVGKRIRCHYQSQTNQVGEFSRLGKGKGIFIPTEAVPKPDGDFYFIMVHEVNGKKLLIADRNIQNYISYSKLILGLNEKSINNYPNSKIRLIEVGREEKEQDEWKEFIQDLQLTPNSQINDEIIWNHERDTEKTIGLYSFIQYDNGASGLYSKLIDKEYNDINSENHLEIDNIKIGRLYGFRPLAIF